LLAKHRGAWLGAARPFIYTWEDSDDSPGFIARAQCSFAKLTAGFAHIRALGPRLIVSATEPRTKRETVAVATLPLGTLYGLAPTSTTSNPTIYSRRSRPRSTVCAHSS
jgi:hypothetical protein